MPPLCVWVRADGFLHLHRCFSVAITATGVRINRGLALPILFIEGGVIDSVYAER